MATVRKATLEDLPQLQAMARAFMEQTAIGGWMQYSAKQIEELVKPMVAGAGVIFIAEDVSGAGRVPIGMVSALGYADPFTGPTCDEVCWWVDPEHRSGLVGPRLLRALENWARQKGLRLLKMVAPAEAPEVGEFYLRSGYTPIQTAFVKRLD